MAARADFAFDPVDAIMAVMAEAFEPAYGEAWTRRQVSDALLLGTCRHMLIAADGTTGENLYDEAVGFYLARKVLDEVELLLFAVKPAWRGRGLGAALLDTLVQGAAQAGVRRLFLEMRAGNPAVNLYEGFGFRRIGSRPAYYRGADGQRLDAESFERSLVEVRASTAPDAFPS